MTAFRVLWILLALCAALPVWAAPAVQWEQCDPARSGVCRPVVPEHMALAAPITTINAVVIVPPDAATAPLAVDIDAMASARVRWNGVVIGSNGVPATQRAPETPGRFSASFPVPSRLVRSGENRVTVTLSAHHLWLPVDQPIHRLAIGAPRDADAYTLRHYLPTLVTLALPTATLLLLSALLLAGRVGRPLLLPMAIMAVIVVQGLLEVSKVAVPYTYPWHLARLVALAGLTAIAGLLFVLLTCRIVRSSRPRTVVAATAAAMLIACAIVSGLDRKALAMFEIALLAAAAAAVPGLMRREPRAIALAAVAVLLAIWAHSAGPNFLDTGYYLTAAGAAVALGVAAVFRPVRAVEVPAPGAAGERTIAFRDGSGHHLLLPSRIAFVKADDDYCTFHMVDGREVTVTMALKATLALLPPDFLRIHRGHAINLRHLSGIQPGPNGRIAKLAGGATLPIGRTYVADLHALIANMAGTERVR